MRVSSAEELIFRKYPLVCSYCRKAPHDDLVCKQVRGTEAILDHRAVRGAFQDNWEQRPVGLDEWRSMFQQIYPRNLQDGSRSIVGLMEELGELGESVGWSGCAGDVQISSISLRFARSLSSMYA